MSKGKIAGYAILGVIILTIIIVGGWGFATGFKYFTAEKTGQAEAERQIQSAEFRIFSYEHFFNAIAEINSAKAEYDQQYDLLQTTDSGTDDYTRIQRNLAAIGAHIERLINQYNADAAKEETRGQFKTTSLPNHITLQPHEYGDRIQ